MLLKDMMDKFKELQQLYDRINEIKDIPLNFVVKVLSLAYDLKISEVMCKLDFEMVPFHKRKEIKTIETGDDDLIIISFTQFNKEYCILHFRTTLEDLEIFCDPNFSHALGKLKASLRTDPTPITIKELHEMFPCFHLKENVNG